ncbi:hypothetical protein [uncultured Brachyspira sp.]|uniref:hypothetical protein n=1 Tax=uncultured Brachyspira sp. TaxID=221953 RepID=UPI0025E8B56E|nr:hypothetical protein [uncultured Brachyspira sp.]
MKHLKKIIFTAVLAAALSTSAFAASGFEFILNVPLGMNIGMGQSIDHIAQYNGEKVYRADYSPDNFLGFTTGVEAQVGYMFQVVNNFGISLLGEVGYRFDTITANYSYSYGTNNLYKEGDKLRENPITSSAHSFKIGLFPKFNIKAFSIGIGGGIIIPVSGSIVYKGNDGINHQVGDNYKAQFDKSELPVGLYFKLSLDYSIFFTETSALNLGLYATFTAVGGLKIPDNSSLNDYPKADIYYYRPFTGIDVGAQIGYRFGPKAF